MCVIHTHNDKMTHPRHFRLFPGWADNSLVVTVIFFLVRFSTLIQNNHLIDLEIPSREKEERKGLWDCDACMFCKLRLIKREKMWLPNNKGSPANRRGNGTGVVAIAIDKDKGSQYAIKWATDNLVNRGQTLVLVHVVTKPTSSSCMPPSPSLSLYIYVFEMS